MTVSPDGTNLYTGSDQSDAVAVFDRDPDTGALTQKPGTDGCISDTGTNGTCADGTALNGVRSVTVSPDGTNVYTASAISDAVTVFDRDPDTGALTQKPGTAGCISNTGSGGACTDGTALDTATSVAAATDGTNLYAAAANSDAVVVFDRDPTTGALTQKPDTDGCISASGNIGCAQGVALDYVYSVTVSADGASVYAASAGSDAVVVFDRCGFGTGLFCVSGAVSDTAIGVGPVPAAGAPAVGVWVVFVDAATGSPAEGTVTDAVGAYRVAVPAGDYVVGFVDPLADRVPEWFGDVPLDRPDLAAVVTVDGPGVTIDAELAAGGRTGSVTGTITDSTTGDPLTGAWAAVIDPNAGLLVAGAVARSDPHAPLA